MKIFCFANLRQIHETASKLSFHLFTVRSQLFISSQNFIILPKNYQIAQNQHLFHPISDKIRNFALLLRNK